MFKYKTLYLGMCIVLMGLLASCGANNKSESDAYALKETSTQLQFPLDNKTSLLIKAMFPYTDASGKEYLTFQNDKSPEILFYDVEKGCLDHKLELHPEGPNGVGLILGYHIKSDNEIYLTPLSRKEIIIVNSKGEILKKIPFEQTSEGDLLTSNQSMTFTYTPLIFINNKIYLNQKPNRFYEPEELLRKSPVTVVLDTMKKEVYKGSFCFPEILPSEDYGIKTLGTEFLYSRIYDGNQIVYSFWSDEKLYLTSKENTLIKTIPVNSKYLGKVKAPGDRPVDVLKCIKMWSEVPLYGNLIYDPYREVYYRVAYPETEIESQENFGDIWQFGRKVFSIIILDKEFNVIGETLFPEYIYISTLMFVRKDGLYISNSHYKNPDFNEDILSFKKFELVKEK